MMRTLPVLILILILMNSVFASPVNPLPQSEQVLSFDSIINVNPDASIDVAETISVYANKQLLEHGIVRRLPLRMGDGHTGGIKMAAYQIKSVLQNSASASFFTQRDDYQLRVFIGDKKNVLTPGVNTYVLRYRVANAVHFAKHVNQLYWNVTGNNWDLPILKASVMVNLPQHARILKENAYAGTINSALRNYRYSKLATNQILFSTTKPLAPGEAFTVALDWPQGYVYAEKAHQGAPAGSAYSLLKKLVLAMFITFALYYVITKVYRKPEMTRERANWWEL